MARIGVRFTSYECGCHSTLIATSLLCLAHSAPTIWTSTKTVGRKLYDNWLLLRLAFNDRSALDEAAADELDRLPDLGMMPFEAREF